jgi:hypothetical protein
METQPLPDELRRFVLRSVPSVPFVEGFLIYRELAGAPLAIDTLAHRLYLPERDAAQIVEELRAARIVEPVPQSGGHRYAPDPELVPVLDLLAHYYRARLVEVTALIHSRTGRMAQQFADAFKLRKD